MALRPDRQCPVCGGSKNEDDDICNICAECGETLDDGTEPSESDAD